MQPEGLIINIRIVHEFKWNRSQSAIASLCSNCPSVYFFAAMSYCINSATICLEDSTILTNQNVTVYWPTNQIPLVSTMDLTLNLYSGNLNYMQVIDPCTIDRQPVQRFQLSQNRVDNRVGSHTIMISESESVMNAMNNTNEFFLQLIVPYPRICMLGPWVTNVFNLKAGPPLTLDLPRPSPTPSEIPLATSGSISTAWIVIIVVCCSILLSVMGFGFYRYKTKKSGKPIPADGFDYSEHSEETIKASQPPKVVKLEHTTVGTTGNPLLGTIDNLQSIDRSLRHTPSYSRISLLERERSLRQTPSLSHLETSTIDIPIADDAVYRAIDSDKETIEQGLETLSRGLRRLDQGLEQLDIGLHKLDELYQNKKDKRSSAQLIAHAFREQLTNPPEGWESRSVE
jgi:hypothetical protein